MILLSIRNLRVYFNTENKIIKAVDDLNLDIHKNEITCLVGESGSGKTISALAITKLLPAKAKIISGQVIFDNQDLLLMPEDKLHKIRGSRISYIFQEPASCLNPVFTIGQQLTETISIHQNKPAQETYKEALKLLSLVKILDPKRVMSSYPHQISGGMNQRAMIAMALANKADLLIADEPTTALDVSIEAQIMELLSELKDSFSLTILMITHDLGIVRKFSDRVAIIEKGKIVETSTTVEIFNSPVHPYTKKLIAAVEAL